MKPAVEADLCDAGLGQQKLFHGVFQPQLQQILFKGKTGDFLKVLAEMVFCNMEGFCDLL